MSRNLKMDVEISCKDGTGHIIAVFLLNDIQWPGSI